MELHTHKRRARPSENADAGSDARERLTAADTRELCGLCREGMLYQVEEWIRNGNSVVPYPRTDEYPLVIAAARGFHSLVVLLCGQYAPQSLLNAALAAAAVDGNEETVQLLLSRGAAASAVDARKVLCGRKPEIAYHLYKHGMDMTSGHPLAHALADQSEEALAFFQRYRNRISGLTLQASMALRHFVIKGNEYMATRLKRAGASPRKRVPVLVPRWKQDWAKLSALEEAAHTGSFRMLLRLGVRKSDDLKSLVEWACCNMDEAKIMHLIDRGARIDDQKNGGSTILQRCFRKLGAGGYFRSPSYQEETERALRIAKALVERGAKWKPDRGEIRDVRAWLAKTDPGWSVSLARLLVEKQVASRDVINDLYATPMMHRHLGRRMEDIERLLGHIPRPRRRT